MQAARGIDVMVGTMLNYSYALIEEESLRVINSVGLIPPYGSSYIFPGSMCT